jgi:hypothetical protein
MITNLPAVIMQWFRTSMTTSPSPERPSGRPCSSRVGEDVSMQEMFDILNDDEAVADLRQSREDFAAGDIFDAELVRGELDRRRREDRERPTR